MKNELQQWLQRQRRLEAPGGHLLGGLPDRLERGQRRPVLITPGPGLFARTRWLFLPVLLFVLALPAVVQAQFTFTTNSGAITITGYTGSGGAVTIPDTTNGLPVTSIGDAAFRACFSLASITIPNSVTTIGDFAFYDCGLTNVTIADSITNIGNHAFAVCGGLTAITVDALNPVYSSVAGVLFNKSQATLIQCPGRKGGAYTIPNSVTSIGKWAFESCIGLISVTIPNSVTNIGDSAFYDCDSLTSVTIGTNVTSIGNAAFWSTSLTGVNIPNSVTTIGNIAFAGARLASVTIGSNITSIGTAPFTGCYPLMAITVNALNPAYSSVAGVLFNKNQTTLIEYPYGTKTSYNISNRVTSIGESAFSGTILTNVTIPSSVTNVQNEAFAYCHLLTAITVDTLNSFYRSVAGVLFDKTQTTLIQFPGGIAGSYTIPSSVTTIGDNAFAVCALTNVAIGSNVTSIGDSAFEGCFSLGSITIPNSVVSIGENAFDNCSRLTSVTIPNSVTSIGESAFGGCRGLTSVTIPNSVISIGDYTFSGCSGLTSVTIANSVTSIGDQAFSSCTSLTGVYFNGNAPASVYMCSSMTPKRPSITCRGPRAGARRLAGVRPCSGLRPSSRPLR